MKFVVRSLFSIFVPLFTLLAIVGCTEEVAEGEHFLEKESTTTYFTNVDVAYMGDDIGESLSDGWVIKLYTDMEIDDLGNPVGPGSVMQLLLNVTYEKSQEPNLDKLCGRYISQSSSMNFDPFSFVHGFMQRIDLPSGYIDMPDATFFATVADGSIEMDVDLLDDGEVNITRNANNIYTIKGVLVGTKCRKRYFEWSGVLEPRSMAEPEIQNSTLTSDIELTSLTKGYLLDRGDIFFLQDQSCRAFTVFLGEEAIVFDQWGKPFGTGDLLRLELLVPWQTKVEDGVPAGTYTMLTRNEGSSINKEDIVPFRAVSGSPDNFSYPYWSGSWYVDFLNGSWSSSYARIDGGTVKVERGEDGSHRFICDLKDCSSPAHSVTTDVTIANSNLFH